MKWNRKVLNRCCSISLVLLNLFSQRYTKVFIGFFENYNAPQNSQYLVKKNFKGNFLWFNITNWDTKQNIPIKIRFTLDLFRNTIHLLNKVVHTWAMKWKICNDWVQELLQLQCPLCTYGRSHTPHLRYHCFVFEMVPDEKMYPKCFLPFHRRSSLLQFDRRL